jgi:SAM-dependent methyltransferase
MRIVEAARNLEVDEHGVWTSSVVSAVSYPIDGNSQCFQLEDGSFWFRHRNDCIVAAIRRFQPPGPILDVGGGNGFVTRRLLDEGFDAALLEPGPSGALNARTRRHIPEVICASFEQAGFASESLSAIGVFDVVEHVADDRAFVDQIHDALSAGGMLYATVPAHAWLWSSSDSHAEHYRRYNRRMVVDLLDESFDLLFFTYFFRALVVPVFLLRTLPYRLGLARGNEVLSQDSEHGTSGGVGARMIAAMLAGEVARIARGEGMDVGASCLFVARKRVRA